MVQTSLSASETLLAMRNYDQHTAEEDLLVAAEKGDIARVANGLRRVHPSKPRGLRGYRALHYACKRGHGAVVRLLLTHGADASMQSTVS